MPLVAVTREKDVMAEHAPTCERHPTRAFLVMARDGDGSASARAEHLDGHLEHIERNWRRYLACGPFRPPGESTIRGSFFLVGADDEESLRALLDKDPYFACGMYASVETVEVNLAAGEWMGGVIWEDADSVRQYSSQARTAGG